MLAMLMAVGMMQTEWQALADAPAPFEAGAGIVECGGRIYAMRGGATRDFWSYDLVRNEWAARAAVPCVVDATASITTNGTDVFVLAESRLCRYVVLTDTWSELGPTPAPCGEGACVVPFGSGFLATRGGGSNEAWKLGSFGELNLTVTLPTPIDSGASMKSTDDGVHVIPGGGGCLRYTLDSELVPTSSTILSVNQVYTWQAVAGDQAYIADGCSGTLYVTPLHVGELKPILILPDRLGKGSVFDIVKGAFIVGIGGTAKLFRRLIPSADPAAADPKRAGRCSASSSGSLSWLWLAAPVGLLLRRRRV